MGFGASIWSYNYSQNYHIEKFYFPPPAAKKGFCGLQTFTAVTNYRVNYLMNELPKIFESEVRVRSAG